MKSDADVSIDLYERMPAPFGLIRYGVAPDHPRIKGIITALHKVLDKDQVRLLGNIDYGTDITLDDLRQFYDAVIFSTGANADRALPIPGIDLDGSYGAADFVSWYDGHPDVPRSWPLEAEKVAVLGVGNVALDVARVLAKTGDELLPTEIPPNVYKGLKANKAVEVHVFGRRGPAQAKFTPLELRELDHSPTIEVIVDPEDIDYDEGSEAARRNSKQVDMVANTLEQWAIRDQGNRPHKLFLHFFESPAEVIGEDGKVVGLKTERTQLDGTGNVKGTGEFKQWDVQAIYRAVGYRSGEVADIPFDEDTGTVPHTAGRVLADGGPLPGVYVTGWIKRGPVGLIGHTKGDANETVACPLRTLAARHHRVSDRLVQ
ncbi:pyridine nucleotide-disulfide oxidoreductase, partial [Gordonia aichiensis]